MFACLQNRPALKNLLFGARLASCWLPQAEHKFLFARFLFCRPVVSRNGVLVLIVWVFRPGVQTFSPSLQLLFLSISSSLSFHAHMHTLRLLHVHLPEGGHTEPIVPNILIYYLPCPESSPRSCIVPCIPNTYFIIDCSIGALLDCTRRGVSSSQTPPHGATANRLGPQE